MCSCSCTYNPNVHRLNDRKIKADMLSDYCSGLRFMAGIKIMNSNMTVEEYKKEMARIDSIFKERLNMIFQHTKLQYAGDIFH